jgi:hypothetical protein
VEGARPYGLAGDHPLDAVPHFVGGFVGESQRQNLPRGNSLMEEVGNAVRDDARLAAARTGQNQQRPFDMFHRLALGRREGGKCVLDDAIHASIRETGREKLSILEIQLVDRGSTLLYCGRSNRQVAVRGASRAASAAAVCPEMVPFLGREPVA